MDLPQQPVQDQTARGAVAPGAALPGVATGGGVLSFSATQLLVMIVLLFLVTPLAEGMPYGQVIEAVVFTVVLLSATLAVGGRRRVLIIAGLLLAPALIAKWAHHLFPDAVPDYLAPAASMFFTAFIAFELLTFVIRARHVTHEIVSAAISAYLVLGLTWTFAYLIVADISPGAFVIADASGGASGKELDPFTAFYFSFITLLTIGYGDIVPVAKVARSLAVCEGLTGTLFMVTLLGRLVSLYTPHGKAAHGSAESRSS